MTKTILDLLSDYVEQGGTLLLALPHLSTRLDREYYDYQISDLIGGGNLAPLINVKVSGFHTFGKAAKQSSWLSNTEVARVELGQGVDVVKNEGGYPLLVRQKHGKGSVNLLLTRAYPGRKELASFYKKIVGDMAEQFKGGVFIDSDYATRSYINYAVYGDRVYLLNIDGQNSHTFNLILGSEKKKITLTPCEFQVVYYSHSDKL